MQRNKKKISRKLLNLFWLAILVQKLMQFYFIVSYVTNEFWAAAAWTAVKLTWKGLPTGFITVIVLP